MYHIFYVHILSKKICGKPIAKDTILVHDKLIGKKNQKVGKYLIQISIRE